MFKMENPVWKFIGKLVDVFVVNMLFILCSLPVVTIVPSCSAMYYVTLKLVRDEENYPAKSFFKFFKKNIKQGMILSLITLGAGVLFAADIYLYNAFAGDIPGSAFLIVLMVVLLFVWFMVMIYVCPIFARFDNSTKNILKNALLMAIAHLPKTLLMMVITIVLSILGIFVPILWFGLIAFANSYILVKIFDHYMPEDQEKKMTPEERVNLNQPISSLAMREE